MALLLDRLCDPNHRWSHPYSKHVHKMWRDNNIGPSALRLNKFVITDEVIDVVRNLGEQCPMPVLGKGGIKTLWAEYKSANKRTVAALIDDLGGGIVFVEDGDNLGDFVIKVKHNPAVTLEIGNPDYLKGDKETSKRIAQLYTWMVRALSLMDHPKIVTTLPSKPVDQTLQRSRVRSGKQPLADYREVVIHISKQEREARQKADELYEKTGKRLHRVRSFVRVKNGKLERVKEHWRGDASIGSVGVKNYKIKL